MNVGLMPQTTNYFRQWYEDNEYQLSQKRKKLYATNAEYRQKALDRSAQQREESRKPRPSGYTLTLQEAANIAGIPASKLREWKKKNYFPDPLKFSSRIWFTHNQALLLGKLAQFFFQVGFRVTTSKRSMLEDKVNWLHSNWNQN